MPYIEISSRDGAFDVRAMTDASADSLRMQGGDPIHVEDDVYEAWLAHLREHRAYNTIWRSLSNEHGLQLRMRELTDNVVRLRGIVELARRVAEADDAKKTQTKKKKS